MCNICTMFTLYNNLEVQSTRSLFIYLFSDVNWLDYGVLASSAAVGVVVVVAMYSSNCLYNDWMLVSLNPSWDDGRPMAITAAQILWVYTGFASRYSDTGMIIFMCAASKRLLTSIVIPRFEQPAAKLDSERGYPASLQAWNK